MNVFLVYMEFNYDFGRNCFYFFDIWFCDLEDYGRYIMERKLESFEVFKYYE